MSPTSSEQVHSALVSALAEIRQTQGQDVAKSILREAIVGKPKAKQTKKPEHWSRLSNAPYYKEGFALQLKSEIDHLLLTGEPFCFRYDKNGMRPRSAYLLVNQAIRYLRDKLDDKREKLDDGSDNPDYLKYGRMHLRTYHNGNKTGVNVEMLDFTGTKVPTLVFDKVVVKNDTNKWQADLDEFIANSPLETKYENRKVNLTAEEVEELREKLEAVRDDITTGKRILYWSLDTNRIMILKTENEL